MTGFAAEGARRFHYSSSHDRANDIAKAAQASGDKVIAMQSDSADDRLSPVIATQF